MRFWTDGKPMDTETMTAKDKIQLLAGFEVRCGEVVEMIAEFNRSSDVRQFSVKHFGRDGVHQLYTDRVHVSKRLEEMLVDLLTSDHAKALEVLGVEHSYRSLLVR